MSEQSRYRLGLSPIRDTVFVGKVNKEQTMWLERPPRRDVTDSFISTLLEWLVRCDKNPDGKHELEVKSGGRKWIIEMREVQS